MKDLRIEWKKTHQSKIKSIEGLVDLGHQEFIVSSIGTVGWSSSITFSCHS